MLDLALEHDLIQKSGSFFSYGETRLGQGRNNTKEHLRQNPELQRRSSSGRCTRSSGPDAEEDSRRSRRRVRRAGGGGCREEGRGGAEAAGGEAAEEGCLRRLPSDDEAYELALKALGRKERTEAELARWLRERGVEEAERSRCWPAWSRTARSTTSASPAATPRTSASWRLGPRPDPRGADRPRVSPTSRSKRRSRSRARTRSSARASALLARSGIEVDRRARAGSAPWRSWRAAVFRSRRPTMRFGRYGAERIGSAADGRQSLLLARRRTGGGGARHRLDRDPRARARSRPIERCLSWAPPCSPRSWSAPPRTRSSMPRRSRSTATRSWPGGGGDRGGGGGSPAAPGGSRSRPEEGKQQPPQPPAAADQPRRDLTSRRLPGLRARRSRGEGRRT